MARICGGGGLLPLRLAPLKRRDPRPMVRSRASRPRAPCGSRPEVAIAWGGRRRPTGCTRAKPWPSGIRRLGTKRLQQWAHRILASIAGSHRVGQDPLHPFEVGDPRSHIP